MTVVKVAVIVFGFCGEVGELASPSFRARESAEAALVQGGMYAVPITYLGSHSPDPEVARRAQRVYEKILRTAIPPRFFTLRAAMSYVTRPGISPSDPNLNQDDVTALEVEPPEVIALIMAWSKAVGPENGWWHEAIEEYLGNPKEEATNSVRVWWRAER